MRTLNLSIPGPHSRQAEIEKCASKRIAINAGRRAGKTFMVARSMVRKANEGHKELYIAPVAAQTDAVWSLCCDWLADAILIGVIKKNETRRTLEFLLSGGHIECRTGNKPDHLRGTWANDLYLDEYAYQDETVWTKVGAPMMLDSDGTVWFISTPNLRNHFYHLYLKAREDPGWAVFTFSSLDNPHLSKEALDSMVGDMTDVDYRQEILAEFVPGVGAVFTVRPEDFYQAPAKPAFAHQGHRIVAGLDWGQKEDYTALSIGCATCCRELGIHRLRKIDYNTQREFIKNIIKDYPDIELLAEANAMGQPNIEALWADGIEAMPFTTTNATKAGIVQGLRLAFMQSAWKWINDRDAWLELEAFEMTVNRNGLQVYGAPEGLHDDTVIARCLMLHQATIGRFTLG